MLKVVLDTNTFISGTIQTTGTPALILGSWRNNDFILLSSKSIVQEVNRVFHYPHIQQNYRLSNSQIESIIMEICTFSIMTPEKISLNIIKDDPDDNKILECAVEAQADYIVSGDKKHLLKLGSFQGIKILSPAEFLEVL